MSCYKRLILFLFMTISVGLFGQEERQLIAFNAVSINGDIQAELVHSDTAKVVLVMNMGSSEDVITDVVDGVLTISMLYRKSTRRPKPNVKIYYTSLDAIKLTNGAKLFGNEEISSPSFKIDIQRNTSLRLTLTADFTSINLRDRAMLQLKGSTKSAKIKCSTIAVLDAPFFEIDKADVSVSQGGRVDIHVVESISPDVDGGSITYRGAVEEYKVYEGLNGSIKKVK